MEEPSFSACFSSGLKLELKYSVFSIQYSAETEDLHPLNSFKSEAVNQLLK